MDAQRILDTLRPLVLVVDGLGTIEGVHGGFGGFLGYPLDGLIGTSVFDLVRPDEIGDLATYFLESDGVSDRSMSLSLPFRVTVVAPDGVEHAVDVIPSGVRPDGHDAFTWVVTIVPVAMNTALSRAFDAEMAGAPREIVRETLAEELSLDNDAYTSRWFLVDLTDPAHVSVTTSRAEARPMAEAIEREIADRSWAPWTDVAHGVTVARSVDSLPPRLAAVAAERSWRRLTITPVHLDRAVVAVYVMLGSVPDDFDVMQVKGNVTARNRSLVDVTAMLFARWRDGDRLLSAATRDSLTGLANRDAFSDALSTATSPSAVLYVDVDRFKLVNDRWGHEVGDRVLVEVARRIEGVCRPGDIVARVGGDEFVVLLDGVDREAACVIGERVVAAVGRPLGGGNGPDRVDVSIGLAPLIDCAGDAALIDADLAMLRAKRDGRARLVAVS